MHPLVNILSFLLLLMAISISELTALLILLIVLGIAAFWLQRANFWRAIKRMRWLFISILLIDGLTTPGEYIAITSFVSAITFEGVALALVQTTKLTIALAAMVLFIGAIQKDKLLIGLYQALRPFEYLGFSVKRFSVRLSLTLEYVEMFASKSRRMIDFNHFDRIDDELSVVSPKHVICFDEIGYTLADKVMLALLCMGFVTLLVWMLR